MTECSFYKTERECDYTCFPCTFMHGLDNGKGGLWSTTGVPNKYKCNRLNGLPIKDENPKAYELISKYIDRILYFVQEKEAGLFLYSIPTDDNSMGTGTGKTTTATTVLNHYVIERARVYFRGEQELRKNPALFVKCTELQNVFNDQFRGTFEQREQATFRFHKLKESLKYTELVVMDDIATRGSRISEAFEEQLYEILDYRSAQVEHGATIFTANVNMSELAGIIGERAASRIDGMTVKVGFRGKDNRINSLFN